MSFDHDRPDPLQPDEWELSVVTDDGATVLVAKVGGGTIGRAYDGAWHYSYTLDDRHEVGSDLVTGTPCNHIDAAHLVAEFMADES